MSKSILVIDTPESCEECQLRNWGIGGWSCVGARRLLEGPIAEREEWCPLRPLPERLPEISGNIRYFGWNACLDEILGGDENASEDV